MFIISSFPIYNLEEIFLAPETEDWSVNLKPLYISINSEWQHLNIILTHCHIITNGISHLSKILCHVYGSCLL